MKRILVFAALIAWSGLSGAVVYKWVDASGKVQYGDRPPDGVHAELVDMAGVRSARNAPADNAAPANSGTAAGKAANKVATPAGDDAKKSVDADVEQTRDKQCADAQDRYKKLIEGRRLYKEGPNGERQYLTSDEIDSERVNAKRDADAICNSTT